MFNVSFHLILKYIVASWIVRQHIKLPINATNSYTHRNYNLLQCFNPIWTALTRRVICQCFEGRQGEREKSLHFPSLYLGPRWKQFYNKRMKSGRIFLRSCKFSSTSLVLRPIFQKTDLNSRKEKERKAKWNSKLTHNVLQSCTKWEFYIKQQKL